MERRAGCGWWGTEETDSKSIFCFSSGLKPEQGCVLDSMFVSLPNSFVEILVYTVMVLKGGV